jgi:hypothetical protein
MRTLGEMLVKILGSNAEFDHAINKSEKILESFAKKTRDIGKSLTKWVTLPILGAATAAIKFAVDAEETSAKFGTAFRDVRKEADITAKNLAKNYGLSALESERLLSTTGDLLKGFGATGAEALYLSEDVQQLAVDLASYNNIQGGAARASEIITKAMLGERDALISLGVKISDADVQLALMESGMEDAEGQALLLAQAQATLKLITEQSGDAMGDFERTQDSVANQLRVTRSQLIDVATAFGKEMLPTVNKVLGNVGDFLSMLQSLDTGQRKVIISTGLVVATFGPLLLITGKMVTAFIAVKTAITAATVAFAALNVVTKASIIGAVVGVVGLLTAGIAKLIQKSRQQKAAQEELNETLRDGAEATGEAVDAQREMSAESEMTYNLLKKGSIERQISSLELMADRNEAAAKTLKEYRDQVTAIDNRIAILNGTQQENAEGTETLTQGQQDFQEVLARLRDELGKIDEQERLNIELGYEYNASQERKAAVLNGLNELIERGYSVEKANIQGLLGLHGELITSYDDEIAAQEELNETKERATEVYEAYLAKMDAERAAQEANKAAAGETSKAYYDLFKSQMTQTQQAIIAISEQKYEYIEAGVDRVTAEEWAQGEIDQIRQDAHDKELQRQRDLVTQVTSITSSMLNSLQGLFNQYYTNQLTKLDQNHTNQLTKLDQWYEAQKDALETKYGDTEEYYDALENLDEEYYDTLEDLDEDYDDKKKQLDYDKAVREKAFALFDVAIKTAQAIVGFLVDPGGTAGIALAIAAGVLGGIQAALIAAEPLPQLAAGGIVNPRPGGTDVTVGEGGQPEVISPLDKLGDMLNLPDDDTGDIHLVVNLDSKPFLDKVFPATRNRTVLIDGGAVV